MNRETSLKRETPVESQTQFNINNMKMNIEAKIDINLQKIIIDMMCLTDGKIIVVERFGTVNIFSSDGKLQKHLPIAGEARSITQINENTIAIPYHNEKAIKIINMENETVTKVFKLDKVCSGLSFSNNNLAVGLNYNEIRMIDLEGNTVNSIQVESKSTLFILVYCNNKIIYLDYLDGAVYCYDESGKQIWRYTQDLSSPYGLCTDTYGNIIVANYYSNSIVVISKDGQNSKVLISEEDGLVRPQCICFKHNESSGFICDERGNKIRHGLVGELGRRMLTIICTDTCSKCPPLYAIHHGGDPYKGCLYGDKK